MSSGKNIRRQEREEGGMRGEPASPGRVTEKMRSWTAVRGAKRGGLRAGRRGGEQRLFQNLPSPSAHTS